jgi:hypothetical protein
MNYEKQINIQQKANKIIKLLIDNKIPLFQQIEILKLARKKIEFCRKTGAEIKQQKLEI